MNTLKFAQLISTITAFGGSRLDEYEIESVKNAVESIIGESPRVDLKPLFEAIKRGEKINAIKAYRKLTGEGLCESKDAIESLGGKVAAPLSAQTQEQG